MGKKKRISYWIAIVVMALVLFGVCRIIKPPVPEEDKYKKYFSVNDVRMFFKTYHDEIIVITEGALQMSGDFAAAGRHGEVMRSADGFEDAVLDLLAMRAGPMMMKEKDNIVSFYFHHDYQVMELFYAPHLSIKVGNVLAVLDDGWYISYGFANKTNL